MPSRRQLLAATGGLAATGLAGGAYLVDAQCWGLGGDVGSTEPVMQFGYDARNSGVADSTVPATVEERWSTRLDPIEGGLAVNRDWLVVATAGKLVGLNRATGTKRWQSELGQATDAPPAITDDTAYVSVWSGGDLSCRGIAAVDVTDGAKRWHSIVDLDVSVPPTVSDGVVYAGGSINNDHLVALDAETGEERWRTRPGIYATPPAVSDGTVYVGGDESPALFALDAEDGALQWFFQGQRGGQIAPTVVGDTVYIVAGNGSLHALAADTGDPVWPSSPVDGVDHSPAATEDAIYVPKGDAFVALEPDGSRRWSRDDVYPSASPTVAGDRLLLPAGNTLRCLDAVTGDRLWSIDIPVRGYSDVEIGGLRSPSMVADEEVYVPANSGDVIALQAPA